MGIVEVRNLRKTYSTRRKKVEALKGISFEAKTGEIFSLLGANGAGKTTTIKSVLGLVIPDEGEIFVNGINALRHRNKAARYMSAVLEGNRNIHWRLTVKENLEYFGHLRGMGGRKLKERVREIVEYIELTDKFNEIAGKLSRGMQQRLAVGIAILPDTPIVLLDEPTLGLDVESSMKMREILKDLSKSGKCVILSTHDMNLVEEVADRVLIINNGRMVAYDDKEKLMDMFRKRAYRIVLDGSVKSSVVEKLSRFGDINIKTNGETVIDVQLDSYDEIYDLFDILKETKLPLKRIEAEDVRFEKVFLKIVEGSDGK